MLDTMPTKTRMYVRAQGGETTTSLRMSAFTRPASSATPTPTMATMMTPTALRFMKFCTTEVNMNRMPSSVSRLCTEALASSSSWVSGFST